MSAFMGQLIFLSHTGDVLAAYPHIVGRRVSHVQNVASSKCPSLSLRCFHVGPQLLLLQRGKPRGMSRNSAAWPHYNAPRASKYFWNTSWMVRWEGFNTRHQHHNFRRRNPAESAPEGLMTGPECVLVVVSVLHTLQGVDSSFSRWRFCQVRRHSEKRTYVAFQCSEMRSVTKLSVIKCSWRNTMRRQIAACW
jgi:hypothetical protein